MSDKTIVIGDVHGNWNALCDILQRAGAMDENEERVPGFRIISVGDVVNCAPQNTKYRGFYPDDYKVLSHVFERKLIDEIMVGNHELFYTHDRESGRFAGMAYAKHELHEKLEPLMKQMVKEGIYKAATTAHGWLISHAGVAPSFQDAVQITDDVDQVADFLNEVLKTEYHPLIDDIGWSVGGVGVGGIVWFRPDDLDGGGYLSRLMGLEEEKRYQMSDNKIPQIVGHTIGKKNPMLFEPWNMWFIDNGSYMDGLGSGIIWNGESWEPIVSKREERKVVEAV